MTDALDPQRRAYVTGLRALADFIEAHPALPLPYAGSANAYAADKAELQTIAREPGVKWEKAADANFFYLKTRFVGGHSYDVNVDRPAVCRKVVTGTRVIPAKPEETVDEFHWICDEPLLAAVEVDPC